MASLKKILRGIPATDSIEGFCAALEAAPIAHQRLPWLDGDVAMLARYYAMGKDPELIGKNLSHPRNKNAVHNKARSMGLKFASNPQGSKP